MKYLIALIISLSIFILSCKDSILEDTNPSIMTDTLECKLNGETWKPQGGGFGEPTIDVYYSNIFGRLLVDGDNNTGNGIESVTISSNLEYTGEFPLLPGGSPLFGFLDCGLYHYLDTLSEHKVIITKFDKEAKIIQGEFFFTAINPDCLDTIIVTDGRFNATYRED